LEFFPGLLFLFLLLLMEV